ncbi:MAG: alanine racemase [Candidatus Cloacimonetes bacterium]|nr:alanine racemase [Candidatus Cloacimonadota bacterium]MDD4156753.1 alanine racemase [Candidatus Cloacimonadota bacterium]
MNDRSWLEINLDNYVHNLESIKKFVLPHQDIMQIVKADAYGHGAAKIAEIALKNGVTMLGVANAEEGALLRYLGKIPSYTYTKDNLTLDACPILVLSPSLPNEIDLIFENNLIPSITELDFCQNLDNEAKNRDVVYPVHIKIDTGMNRNGIRYDAFDNFLMAFSKCTNLKIEGVFSHFLESEEQSGVSETQIDRFREVLTKIKTVKYIHIANSAGILFQNFKEANIVRLGFLSYGVNINKRVEKTINLKPVMTFKSKISHISTAKKGETIGYNSTFIVNEDVRFAIIPVGYADGYDFLLSNQAKVLVNNELCPVLGRVSMDMICIDISKLQKVSLYDEVILLGEEHPEINAGNIAFLYKGSAYELLAQVGRRAKRYYKINNMIIDQEPIQKRSFIPSDFNSEKLSSIIKNAIAHRIQNNEMAKVIYDDILKYFFIDSDKDISYRSNFKHNIVFTEHKEYKDYYRVKTVLSFQKILHNDTFYVACAIDNESLKEFFKMKNCEYRWIIDVPENHLNRSNDKKNDLNDYFKISKALINDIEVDISIKNYPQIQGMQKGLLFTMNHKKLVDLCGKVVTFVIETETIYHKKAHQLSVYINEITKGAEVSFSFPSQINPVEITSIFAGRERFPLIQRRDNQIILKTRPDMWIFPNSGIVFSY